MNLYAFVANDAINNVDEDGFATHGRIHREPDKQNIPRPCGKDYDAGTCAKIHPKPEPTKCEQRPNGKFGFDVTIDFLLWREFKVNPTTITADKPDGATVDQHEQLHLNDFLEGLSDNPLSKNVPSEGFSDMETCNGARDKCYVKAMQYLRLINEHSAEQWDRHEW